VIRRLIANGISSAVIYSEYMLVRHDDAPACSAVKKWRLSFQEEREDTFQ
jgi:hypothetical protein